MLTEAPAKDDLLLKVLLPHKKKLLDYIALRYGEHKAEKMTGWIEKNWAPSKLKNLRAAIEDQLDDKKLSDILAAAVKSVEFEDPEKKKKLDARDDVFKRKPGEDSKEKARGFFSKEKIDPEDYAAQQASVDAVAKSRPDRSGEKGNTEDPKKHLGIKQMHINKQDSQDGGKDQTVGQRIKQLQKFIEKDPDHALAGKWKKAIDNLAGRDENEVIQGSKGAPSDTGMRLGDLKMSHEEMVKRNNILAIQWKENSGRLQKLGAAKDNAKKALERTRIDRSNIKDQGNSIRALLARNPNDQDLHSQLVSLGKKFDIATQKLASDKEQFEIITNKVQDLSKEVNNAKKEMEELADAIKDSGKEISGVAQAGVSAEVQKQQKVDAMLKNFPPDHPSVINLARRLNVPPPLERQTTSVDKKTGEEKVRYALWKSDKIAKWRLNPNNFDAGKYDLPGNAEKFDDKTYPQVPGTLPGSSKFKNPKSSAQGGEEGRESAPETIKPMMKVPRGMKKDDIQKMSDLQRDYAIAKNSGASEEDLNKIKIQINSIMIPTKPEEPWKQGQVTARPSGNEEMVVRPGRYHGEEWTRSGMSKQSVMHRPDPVTGRMQRMNVDSATKVTVVWDANKWDWFLKDESPSAKAAKAGEERGGEKDIEKPDGQRRDWASGAQNLKPGMKPIPNSAEFQRQAQMLDVPQKPTITPGRVKDVVGTAIKKASDTSKDASDTDTGGSIFPGPKDIGDKAKGLSGISGEYDPKDGSFSVGKPSLGGKKPVVSVDPLVRKKKEED